MFIPQRIINQQGFHRSRSCVNPRSPDPIGSIPGHMECGSHSEPDQFGIPSGKLT